MQLILLKNLHLQITILKPNQLYLEESGPQRAAAVEDLKWKVVMAESLGADRMVIPSAASEPSAETERLEEP